MTVQLLPVCRVSNFLFFSLKGKRFLFSFVGSEQGQRET